MSPNLCGCVLLSLSLVVVLLGTGILLPVSGNSDSSQSQPPHHMTVEGQRNSLAAILEGEWTIAILNMPSLGVSLSTDSIPTSTSSRSRSRDVHETYTMSAPLNLTRYHDGDGEERTNKKKEEEHSSRGGTITLRGTFTPTSTRGALVGAGENGDEEEAASPYTIQITILDNGEVDPHDDANHHHHHHPQPVVIEIQISGPPKGSSSVASGSGSTTPLTLSRTKYIVEAADTATPPTSYFGTSSAASSSLHVVGSTVWHLTYPVRKGTRLNTNTTGSALKGKLLLIAQKTSAGAGVRSIAWWQRTPFLLVCMALMIIFRGYSTYRRESMRLKQRSAVAAATSKTTSSSKIAISSSNSKKHK